MRITNTGKQHKCTYSSVYLYIKDYLMSKWNAFKNPNQFADIKSGWFEKDGKYLFMRSAWELNYARYLNFLISKGEIKNWEYEVKTFWFEGIKRGTTNYKPDFKVYLNDDTEEFHEVKGYMDSKSKTKLNRMRIYHPEVKMKLISAKEYNAIKKNSAIIPDWDKWITVNPNKKK